MIDEHWTVILQIYSILKGGNNKTLQILDVDVGRTYIPQNEKIELTLPLSMWGVHCKLLELYPLWIWKKGGRKG